MKTLHFEVSINAPKKSVWSAMLGQESYKIWTAEFGAGSYYEGSWEKGNTIRFLGPGGGEGMISVIAENRQEEFVSIKHLGFIKNGVDDTDSPEIKAWTPAFENYTFSEINGITTLKVDVDGIPELEEFMENAWPKALKTLKEMCERRA
jgi:hypothetical protein